MARVRFDSVFQVNSDGTITPLQTTRIGGVTISGTVSPSYANSPIPNIDLAS